MIIAAHDRSRTEFFNGMLVDWSDADLHQLRELLARFSEAYDRANAAWLSRASHPVTVQATVE